MSLINQVLNELEQRGAQTASEQTLVRAVPKRAERRWKIPALLATATILVFAAAWLWPKAQQPKVEPQQMSGTIVAAPAAATADRLSDEQSQPAIKMSLELSEIPPAEAARASEQADSPKPVVAKTAVAAQSHKPALAAQKLAANSQSSPAIQLKQISSTQQADAEFRKAMQSQRQGHVAEALAGYEAALKLNEQHEQARLALAALLVESKRGADAERALREGLRLKPLDIAFSMALARVQVELGQTDLALGTLQNNLPQAEVNADYQAFYAALLQREGRHKEALASYQVAVKLAPNNGIWLMGFAISLQAEQRVADAKAAYQRALATQTLSPELTAFVQQKLKEL
ncbi:MAG: hypothetical protein PHQ60_11140 [Sideroxydans sp.]|nr:hypothetical protein [Sideroxydans sp.]